MKCSERWLREWIDPSVTQAALLNQLTLAGFEISQPVPAAKSRFTQVVIGEIIQLKRLNTQKVLHICTVSINRPTPLIIVCGAINLSVPIKVAVALPGATLAGRPTITSISIAGVVSQGMLCSAQELGLEMTQSEPHHILIFPDEAPVGEDCWEYLQLSDYLLEIGITPNRGDCLSICGIAREIAAITHTPFIYFAEKEASLIKRPHDRLSICIQAPAACPSYVARIIRHINPHVTTPLWLFERLRRSGIRPTLYPIVDITNYVMLELGQPLHAFDLSTVQENIVVRYAKCHESITLLDHRSISLNQDTLVIADQEKPIAIAGIMGGLYSSITAQTTHILLESAYFNPEVIAKQKQTLNISSEAAFRFERGVDATIQKLAIERATQLILQIMGGNTGPLMEEVHKEYLPHLPVIELPYQKVSDYLGLSITRSEIETIFKRLQLTYEYCSQSVKWFVQVPSYRLDLKLPEDLIEEIMRLYGYERIPYGIVSTPLQVPPIHSTLRLNCIIHQALIANGYHEVMTYPFIASSMQQICDPQQAPLTLINPITIEMQVMRTNLWPGLLSTWMNNVHYQPQQVRLFEIGTCFIQPTTTTIPYQEEERLAGLATGTAFPVQWGHTTRSVDFYDVKGHLMHILDGLHADEAHIRWEPGTHPALHPKKTAIIYYQQKEIGILGALHPTILQKLDRPTENIYLFELYLKQLGCMGLPPDAIHSEASMVKFPEIRRDIALLVNLAIPAQAIQDTIKDIAGSILKGVFVFDLYQGENISTALKSMALTLIFQHPERTLIDQEITILMDQILTTLKRVLGATLRS